MEINEDDIELNEWNKVKYKTPTNEPTNEHLW